jgi:hypothetical protein
MVKKVQKKVQKKKETLTTIVKAVRMQAMSEHQQYEWENRVITQLSSVGTYTSMRMLADVTIRIINKDVRIMQERTKIYRYYMKLIRAVAEANSMDIKLRQNKVIYEIKRAAAVQEQHLREARENSEIATLADQAAKSAS